MTTRQELEKMVEEAARNVKHDNDMPFTSAKNAYHAGAAFVMDKLVPEIEKLKYEGEKDYEGMREFQKKFIKSDKELTAANERIKELEERLQLEILASYPVHSRRELIRQNEIMAEALKEIVSESHSSLCESMKPYRPNYTCHVEIAEEALARCGKIANKD